MITKDRIGGLGFALIGIIVSVMATQISVQPNLTEPGPRLFPLIAGFGMAICGLGMAFQKSSGQKGQPFLDAAGWKRLGVSAATLILYLIGLQYLGFLISTPIFTFAIVLILAGGKKIRVVTAAIVALITTGALYLLFERVFSIFLPAGKLF